MSDTNNGISKAVQGLTLMVAMQLPRHERRKLARLNGIEKIAGSSTPYVKKERKEDKENGSI